MIAEAILSALPAAALFGALVLMHDRKLGALLAQGALVVAVGLIFVAILSDGGALGFSTAGLAGLGIALVSAAVSGMLYHLYLGRFTRVWAARAVFTTLFMGVSAVFSVVLLSLI
ncbi:hypothetical protein [uncultured Roseicyclus sp.]|jgi:hypothetical protein|uniref:hypothetical protein n=1 Tax=uncultured Roseicyclus sp. TaxID=543072 RepID=UPI0026252A06|nr:hypothetical protein [uncultured Roseicyclus sp.]